MVVTPQQITAAPPNEKPYLKSIAISLERISNTLSNIDAHLQNGSSENCLFVYVILQIQNIVCNFVGDENAKSLCDHVLAEYRQKPTYRRLYNSLSDKLKAKLSAIALFRELKSKEDYLKFIVECNHLAFCIERELTDNRSPLIDMKVEPSPAQTQQTQTPPEK
ncbi:MAG: hypothetical protein AB4050_13310 [Synechococcus sp.]